jgi:DNA-binding CsgD family transcriptional regulator
MAASHSDGDLIAVIYDAILDPTRWEEVVNRIVEATKSFSGGLNIQQGNSAYLSATCNVDPFYSDAYVQTYFDKNPLASILETVPSGKVWTVSDVTLSDTFRASPFFNEFIQPQGWADFVAIGLLREPKAVGLLVLHRSPDSVWVEPAEWHLLETLAPHLQRAAAVNQLLARAQATTDSLGAAVTAAGFALFLLTEYCRVLFANAKGEDLVRRGMGLRYERGRLAATTPALTHRLHALARQGSRPGRNEDIGGTLELPRGENRPPLFAHVIPLAANHTVTIFDLDRPAVAVFVVDPSAGFAAQIQRFAARFGLTSAETRVLAEIIAGNGLLAAAAQLKITEATVRTHAKHILSKTGTNRQTELIRRFFETSLRGSPVGA